MIQLKQYRKNMVEVILGDKHVLFSYNTPVLLRDNSICKTYVTNSWFSKTTTNHIYEYLQHNRLTATYVDHNEITKQVNL